MAKRSDQSRHYINNADLTLAIIEYQKKYKENLEKGLPSPQASNYIGLCILTLCERLVTRWNFAQYSYREEMRSDAIEDCVNALKSFNVEKAKSNAFNYLSMVAFRACQRRIIMERKQNAIKHKNYQHNYSIAELEGSQSSINNSNNEYSNKVIEEFESKHLTKPAKPDNMKATEVKEENRVQSKKGASNPAYSRKSSSKPPKQNKLQRSTRKIRGTD